MYAVENTSVLSGSIPNLCGAHGDQRRGAATSVAFWPGIAAPQCACLPITLQCPSLLHCKRLETRAGADYDRPSGGRHRGRAANAQHGHHELIGASLCVLIGVASVSALVML